ncbi:MAG: hypothetical protein UY58_C0002G0015 [Candidatus Magasanikbacteria bacterium GW2011_GWA2_50_22]|uniref:Uncharacterized protein n=1 Tax=Candidatus Magasanikbacteria bacterium GW2011_GWA2_50_22 TaxID=1619043 RepID=A0A0G1ZE88_9BACT|nr:MAG: hypothetical protein UY58_C0002G0015 [Candidatus Magasanikbacteria bacterium GW2011_GWA2_50_22]
MSDQNNNATTGEVLDFLKEHMVMREDFEEFKTNTDKKFDSIEARLFEIQNELQDIRKSLEALERRTKEDADAVSQDIIELRKRVDFLEAQVQQLQTAAVKA